MISIKLLLRLNYYLEQYFYYLYSKMMSKIYVRVGKAIHNYNIVV